MSDETKGDFITVLSSDLIAEVMENYFNTKMYKFKVEVVDLFANGNNYSFTLKKVKAESLDPLRLKPSEFIAKFEQDGELIPKDSKRRSAKNASP